jgi:uncharacterized damage-inducible protein DinB
MATETSTRDHVSRLLDWEEAHVGFETAVADLPAHMRGTRPPGAPHSIWELVEHIRMAQYDILDFCINEEYQEKTWPDDYWPPSPAPSSDAAWENSLAAVRADLVALKELAADSSVDLAARIPHGKSKKQTYLRELLLVADHTAYHVGQIVFVRQLLGIWKGR